MKNYLTGLMTFLIFFLILLNSCRSDEDDFLKVYDYYGNPLNETFEIVGLPEVRLDSGYYPWKLYGNIINGQMLIDFPDVKLELGSGNKYSMIYIEKKNSSSVKFGLYKSTDYSERAYIYYSTEDVFIPGYYDVKDGMNLKTGWNFVEEMENPKWSYGNDEPYHIYGLISQNIYDFYKKGYRWFMELWK